MKQLHGKALLDAPSHTKSTAFTRKERDQFGLRGLLPYVVADIDKQKLRVLASMHRKNSDIEKYIFLNALLERHQHLSTEP